MTDPNTMNLQEVEDDINLYKTLLESIECQDDMGEDRTAYTNNLAQLEARRQELITTGSITSTLNNATTSQNGAASTASIGAPRSTTWAFPPSLPSRKRDRGEFNDDLDNQGPVKKSPKLTPIDSPAMSSVDSIGSDYFDDPSLSNLLGDDWRRDVRQNRDFYKDQEAKQKQQEEDERLARILQAQWSNTPDPAPQVSRPACNPAAPSTQSTFRPNGSFSMAAPFTKTVQPPIKPEPDNFAGSISSSSSEADLTFISTAEWSSRFPSSAASSRAMPTSFNGYPVMPGAFPQYTSMPGNPVYGQPSNRAFAFEMHSLLGSAGNPFDLDSASLLPRDWEVPNPIETQEEIRRLLHNIRPDEEISLSEASENQPAGLKVKLMPHQVKGLAWMKKMEDSTKGGILADDMGLGKTIQAIALMLSRPPPDDARKPTLIVTPVALMDQWKREMMKLVRANAAFTIATLHGSNAHMPWSRVKHYDVILTSYGTLASELKRKVAWQDKLRLNPDAIKAKKEECSVLDDKARFHRIVLDEAQWIKNKDTKAAQAACRVNGEFRWCLSGTPMQNKVEEIFSLIKFCRIRPYNDLETFARDIARPLKRGWETGQTRAMEKLQALLKAILLRRTKKSTIDGQPILQLPEKHTIEDRAIFDEHQQNFYKALETQSRIQFNKYVKSGTVGQNYSKALVLLLRLRQCCCSPQLVTNSADFVTGAGVEGADLVGNAKELADDVVRRLKEAGEIECPICFDAVENFIIFNPCGHGICHGCFSGMVDSVTVENPDNLKCPHCRAKIDTKKITDYVSFKEVYVEGGRSLLLDADADDDDESDSDTVSDTDSVESDGDDDGADLRDFIVDDDGADLRDFIVDDDAEVDADDLDSEDDKEDDLDKVIGKKPSKPVKLPQSQSNSRPSSKKPVEKLKKKEKSKTKSKIKGKGKGKSKQKDHKSLADLRKEGMKSVAHKKRYLKQLDKIYEPCAKVDKTLAILSEVESRGENEKTIIFSSFTSFLDLLEVAFRREPNMSNYTRYDGSMTAKDRNAAVLRFTDDPDCRVILVSLKAGNAGLNLTVANHVVILDPFWNPFVEYQAADRCYRIGQRREVTVHRVLIGEEGVNYPSADAEQRNYTVEDRILALQEKKRRLVENALDENASSSVGRLGVRELGYLFGVNSMPGQNGT